MLIFKKRYSKTFLKIIIYVALSMVLTVLLVSNFLYRSFEQKGLSVVNEYNMKSLSQLSYNIEYMNEMVRNFCKTQFNDPDVNFLMISKTEAGFESLSVLKIIDKLQKNVVSNSMIHSIIVYNGLRNEYYTTSGWTVKNDEPLIAMLQTGQDIPMLYPIPRVLPEEAYFVKNKKVFTYVLHDLKSDKAGIEGAVVVNVNTDWLFKNLDKMKSDNSNLYLVDREGKVIGDNSENLNLFERLDESYLNRIREDNKTGNSTIVTTNETKRVITYLQVAGTDWILISDQPYETVFSFVKDIRNETIMATTVFLLLSLLISMFVSKIIYRPFNKLIKQVRSGFKDGFFSPEPSDDAEYLTNVLNESINRFKDFEKYRISTRDILKEYLLKTMLLESNTLLNQLPENNLNEHMDILKDMQGTHIVLFKIDNYSRFTEMDLEDRKAIRFIICNISSEVAAKFCKNEVILMGKGECILILDTKTISKEGQLDTIKDCIREIQQNVKNIAKVTLSAFISESIENTELMNKCYKELQSLCKYRLIYGQNCILDREMVVSDKREMVKDYPEKIETRLLEGLNTSNMEAVKRDFDSFVAIVSKMDIDNFVLSLTRLALAINRAVNNMNINRINEISFNFNDFYSNLSKLETIEEISKSFGEMFGTILEQHAVKTENKHSVIVNSIKDYIRMEFKSMDLCLKKVAEEFKLSPIYLGMIFKEYTQKSVQDYINEIRLEKAVSLLKSTDISIYEVIESVGYDNETNFYRLFRKNYGITPKEYRINANLQEMGRKS